MRRVILATALVLVSFNLCGTFGPSRPAAAESGGAARGPANDAAALELKRQQLVEKEAALKAKEEALNRLSAQLDAKVKELNAAQKGIEASLAVKKQQDDQRYKKMIKIYKGLKAEEAGALMNKLDDKLAIEMLNQMDQKTAVKLIPFINQPRVLEWTRLNLAGR